MQHLLRRAALTAALCGVIALVVLPAAGASAKITLKGFTVTISGTANGGTTSTLTATITDNMLLIPVQSAALFVPNGITVTGVTLPAGSHAKSLITKCSGAPCVELTNLGLFYNRSITISMSVTAPAACNPSHLTWQATARSDALISFLLQLFGIGNLPLDGNSVLGTTVADSCTVAFVQQPTDAVISTAISPAVTTLVKDQSGTLMPGIPVSMGLAVDPSGKATLSGMTPETTDSTGTATFGDLSINQLGSGFELDASITGSSATSTPFDVANDVSTCTSGTCMTTAGTSNGSATIQGSGTGTLTESVVPNQMLSCTEPTLPVQGVAADPNTYVFSGTGLGTLTATITITDPSLLNFDYPFESGEASSDFPWGDPTGNDNDWDDALNTQNVCFESSTPFYVVDPTTGLLSASPTTVGILPSCTQPPTGPPTNAPAFAVAPAGYPCHDRLHDTVTQDNGSYYSVALVAIIPPGWDPLMN